MNNGEPRQPSSLELHKKIWGLANYRFLQCEASLWLLKTKTFEILALISLAVFGYLQFVSDGNFTKGKIVSGLIFFMAGIAVESRGHLHDSYFSGYEQGFKDAAQRSIGYLEDEYSETEALNETFAAIEESERQVSEQDIGTRRSEFQKGRSRASSLFRTAKTAKLPVKE